MYDKFMKNAILLAKKQEYVSQKCEKSYFSTKYRISAQNWIRPSLSNSEYGMMTKRVTVRLVAGVH